MIRRMLGCLLLAIACSFSYDAGAVTSRQEREKPSSRQITEKGKRGNTTRRTSSPDQSNKPNKPGSRNKPATGADTAAAQASGDAASAAKQLEGMPVWGDDEEKSMLTGKIWEDMPEVLPPNTKDSSESGESATPMLTEEKVVVESIPEDFTKVLPYYLPEYIRPTEGGLIDPQKLLGEVESNDILMMIAAMKRESGGHIYISIFAPGQAVPPEINAPALARQIFKPGERSILLHIHYGDVKGTQIVCDADMTAKLGDKGRRLLLSKVKEHSSAFTNPQSCLIESIAALDGLASPELRKLFLEEKQKMAPHGVGVPHVNIEFTEKDEVREKHMSAKIKELFVQYEGYAHAVLYGIIVLIVLAGIYLWHRNCKPVRLLQSTSDRRLGAPNGASISRPVNYGSRDDSSPYSISRKQMRDHLRDNS